MEASTNFTTATFGEILDKYEISYDAMFSLAEAFFYKPELITQYHIDPKTLHSGYFDDVFAIYNTLSFKGMNSISNIQVEEAMADMKLTDQRKIDLRDIFASIAGFNEEHYINCVSNVNAYYEEFRKDYILKTYHDNGIDISEFWPLSPKHYRADKSPIIEEMEKAKKRYEETSADGIINVLSESVNNLLKSPDKALQYSSGIEYYKGRKLPGGDKEIEYLIGSKAVLSDDFDHGWMELGSFNSIVAAAKAGKTQLAMQMAFCVQNGIPFFDYPVKKSDVLYVDYELRPNQIYKRLEALEKFYKPELEKAGIKEADDPYYISVSEAFSNGRVDMDAIVKKIRDIKEELPDLRLVIFDCFYTFMEGDANAEEDTKNCLLKLKSLVDDNTTVIYVHHTNKTGTKGMSDLDMIYAAGGSGVHGKIVDTTYVARPKQGSGMEFEVYATGRSCSGEKVLCDKGIETMFFFKKQSEEKKQANIRKADAIAAESYRQDLIKKFNAIKYIKNEYPDFYKSLFTRFRPSMLMKIDIPDEFKDDFFTAKSTSKAKNEIIYGSKEYTTFEKYIHDKFGLDSIICDKNTTYLLISDHINIAVKDKDDLNNLLNSKNFDYDLNNTINNILVNKFPSYFSELKNETQDNSEELND